MIPRTFRVLSGLYRENYYDDRSDNMPSVDSETYIQLVYKARRIILGGGKVPEIMEATGLSQFEAEEIYREETTME